MKHHLGAGDVAGGSMPDCRSNGVVEYPVPRHSSRFEDIADDLVAPRMVAASLSLHPKAFWRG
jgi:hypothetical protein